MFCMGAFSSIAQVVFTRDLLVSFHGNEICVGTVLGVWLLEIGLGAAVAAGISIRMLTRTVDTTAAALFCAIAACLPFQFLGVRAARWVAGVPIGEYGSIGQLFMAASVLLAPTCVVIGLVFPIACRRLATPNPAGAGSPAVFVSRVFTWESAGSMVAGAIMAFWLLPSWEHGRLIVAGCALSATAGWLIAPSRPLRAVAAAFAMAGVVAVAFPGTVHRLDRWSDTVRWRVSGILSATPEAGGAAAARIIASTNTIYQHLLLVESAGQYALYANGQISSVVPDPIVYEHSVHFVMAQRPDARRVLLIGGNPAGEVPELLKYPLQRLVYVATDPAVGNLLRAAMPQESRRVFADRRFVPLVEDGPRYLRRCRETFDMILVVAPDPSSAYCNRYYTMEFFLHARRALAPGGILVTSLASSERLERDAAAMGGSIHRTLRSVFPQVKVTAGARNVFFAGASDAPLTLDRQTLMERSRKAAVAAAYFRPEYFLACDEVDPEKVEIVERRLRAAQVPLNTDLAPTAYLYNMVLWGLFSGSFSSRVWRFAHVLGLPEVAFAVLLLSLAMLSAGEVLRRRQNNRRVESAARWSRTTVGIAMLAAGLSAMALEILLVMVIQGLYGYVYHRMALVFSIFMLGLVLGSSLGRRLAAAGETRAAWRTLLLLQSGLALVAIAIPPSAEWIAGEASPAWSEWFAFVVYCAVAAVGWLGGAIFSVANRLFLDAGGTVARGSAVIDAADHIGAAVGAFATAVLLVPVLGIGASCVAVAIVNCGAILALASGLRASQAPVGPTDQSFQTPGIR
jgi:spermidine synthase